MPLASLFTTPVAMYEHPDMESINKKITAILVAESESIRTVSHSNIGSWHSKFDLHVRPEDCFRKLNQLTVARVRETTEAMAASMGLRIPALTAKAHAWAMVMRDGDYTVPHTHAESHWSTVYYADVGNADEAAHPDSGVITFMDPRRGYRPIPGLDMTGGNFEVRPKNGQLLVFPGWLMHFVHTYRGQRPRVAISCNVIFQVLVPISATGGQMPADTAFVESNS